MKDSWPEQQVWFCQERIVQSPRKVAGFYEKGGIFLWNSLENSEVSPKESPSLDRVNSQRADWHILKHDNYRFFAMVTCFPSSLPFLSKNLLFKGALRDSSLPLSLPYPSYHLSHHPSRQVSFRIGIALISYVAYYKVMPLYVVWVSWERWREWFGRDLGGIKSISPILFPHCTKAFPKIMGEMRPKRYTQSPPARYFTKHIKNFGKGTQ